MLCAESQSFAALGDDVNPARNGAYEKNDESKRLLALKENWVVTYPTCLCPRTDHSGSLEERLAIIKNCLNSFLENFKEEIEKLNRVEFFAGRITTYDESIMQSLHKIFTNEGRGKNWNSITLDFRDWKKYLLADIERLKTLVREKEAQSPKVKILLEDIRSPLIVVSRSVHYYDEYRWDFLQQQSWLYAFF